MTYRRWTLLGAVAAIAVVIWLIESDRMMVPPPASTDSTIPSVVSDQEKARRYPAAKELVGISGYINTHPFNLADSVGSRVILIDFWTYSCINCKRTQPYLNAWWDRYKDEGLLIIGVHTPEFEFEKDPMNVRKAVAQAGIMYPVVQDNEYATWRAYGNQYWPHKYLIDTDGYIVYDHIGEGGYGETEEKIRELLAEHKAKAGAGTVTGEPGTPEGAVLVDFSKVRSPEMYLGALRNEPYLGNALARRVGMQKLSMPPEGEQSRNQIYLSGRWEFTDELARCLSDCRLRLKYSAKQVNLVATGNGRTSVRVFRDGTLWGTVEVSSPTLYTLINDSAGYGEHLLELEIPAGVDLFTFTFG